MHMRLLAPALFLPACVLGAVSADAQVTPYGSGINPVGSLVVTAGVPTVGGSFRVGVSNTATTSAPAALAFLSIAANPDPAFPSGTVLPGFGLSAPGASGELLISFAAPNPLLTVGPLVWAGGVNPPANFAVSVPLLPSLTGLTLYLQGSLLDTAGIPSIGLTNGLAVTLVEPSFPRLVPIEPGTFQMGSDAASGPPYYGPIGPVHQVTISKPFWMGRYELTQAEFQELMDEDPSITTGDDRPVNHVTWFAAMEYCEKLNAQETALGRVPLGYQYRLPTEAEWEYACRAGTTTEYHYGTKIFCDQASIYSTEHSPRECAGWASIIDPVGSYAPNGWGLFDMHGNVWEWCMDTYAAYTASPRTDPLETGGRYNILRGGSWAFGSTLCRSAARFSSEPGLAWNFSYGFRVVLAPTLAPR